jgi:hypothetical protein
MSSGDYSSIQMEGYYLKVSKRNKVSFKWYFENIAKNVFTNKSL